MGKKILPGPGHKFGCAIDLGGAIQINFRDLSCAGLHPVMLTFFT